MLLCLWILLSVGQAAVQGKNDEVDEWLDRDDDVDEQGMFWSAESDDWPTSSSDWDEQDDLDEVLFPVPSTALPSAIPPTSAPPPPISPSTPIHADEIPQETRAEEQSPGAENEVIAASTQEESALLVVLVMTAGTFLSVFAIYTLFSRKGGKKQSQVTAGSKEGSHLLKVPRHGL